MAKQRILTGIKPTGTPHLGNYVGAIRPALTIANETDCDAFYFIADYHAITTVENPEELRHLTYEVAATWIACGLDPAKVNFYRQSDIPEVFELSWIVACNCPKGFMNRAHAYKAMVQQNQADAVGDCDSGINMGLFTYPILMAADILAFDTDAVPVGRDQSQHVEYARDLAIRMNKKFAGVGHKNVFVVPEVRLQADAAEIPGLDGRKMSKSYKNTIPLFAPRDSLLTTIKKIKTDSKMPGEPKDADASLIFKLYKALSAPDEAQAFRKQLEEGLGWYDAKLALFERIDATFSDMREIFDELMKDKARIDCYLRDGSARAREIALPTLARARRAVGIASG